MTEALLQKKLSDFQRQEIALKSALWMLQDIKHKTVRVIVDLPEERIQELVRTLEMVSYVSGQLSELMDNMTVPRGEITRRLSSCKIRRDTREAYLGLMKQDTIYYVDLIAIDRQAFKK